MDGSDRLIVEDKPRGNHANQFGETPGGAVGTLEQAPSADLGTPAAYEAVYRDARGDVSRVPWADGKPNPVLVSWLNAEAMGRVRPGSRAIVVGCGLGDDVIELLNRGYDTIGFDVCPTAVQWARSRFPAHAEAFSVGDLLSLPTRYRHRFELVVESYTLQSLPPASREAAARAIGTLCGPRGLVVAIARGREDNEDREAGAPMPPWPLSRAELVGLMEISGLKPVRAIDDFLDDETPPKRRLRGVFERA